MPLNTCDSDDLTPDQGEPPVLEQESTIVQEHVRHLDSFFSYKGLYVSERCGSSEVNYVVLPLKRPAPRRVKALRVFTFPEDLIQGLWGVAGGQSPGYGIRRCKRL